MAMRPVDRAITNLTDNSQGLLYGFWFMDNQPAQPIDLIAASRWLKRLDAPDTTESDFIWLHFNLSNNQTRHWLEDNLDLPSQFYESFNEHASSTRIEQTEKHLLALVNDVRYGFDFEPSEIATLCASADKRTLITVRQKPLRSIDHLRQTVLQGTIFRSPIDLVAQLFRDQADVMVQIVREVTNKVDLIEDNFLAGKLNYKRNQLGGLRRTLIRLQRLLAPEPSALFRLINRPPSWISEADIYELQQATEEFSTVLHDMAGLQERVKLLQEEIAVIISEQTNRSLVIITSISVLALPVNMIAGLFGMNVGGIPFSDNPLGFWYVVLFVILFISITWVALKNRDD
jgi:zinc transporter